MDETINPTEPTGPETARFVIDVERDTKKNTSKVTIEHDEECPFEFWMCACEYLLHQTARRSAAGFERALELLCQGAMNYKDCKDVT